MSVSISVTEVDFWAAIGMPAWEGFVDGTPMTLTMTSNAAKFVRISDGAEQQVPLSLADVLAIKNKSFTEAQKKTKRMLVVAALEKLKNQKTSTSVSLGAIGKGDPDLVLKEAFAKGVKGIADAMSLTEKQMKEANFANLYGASSAKIAEKFEAQVSSTGHASSGGSAFDQLVHPPEGLFDKVEAKIDTIVIDSLPTELLSGNEAKLSTGEHHFTEGFQIQTASGMKQAPCVKLAQAVRLYQPVSGTSAGSRYFVVGVSDEVNLAIKIEGAQLSLRAEAPKVMSADFKASLFKMGFKDGNGYMSVHLQASSADVGKVIGAVLMGLPASWRSPVPRMSVLKEVA